MTRPLQWKASTSGQPALLRPSNDSSSKGHLVNRDISSGRESRQMYAQISSPPTTARSQPELSLIEHQHQPPFASPAHDLAPIHKDVTWTNPGILLETRSKIFKTRYLLRRLSSPIQLHSKPSPITSPPGHTEPARTPKTPEPRYSSSIRSQTGPSSADPFQAHPHARNTDIPPNPHSSGKGPPTRRTSHTSSTHSPTHPLPPNFPIHHPKRSRAMNPRRGHHL